MSLRKVWFGFSVDEIQQMVLFTFSTTSDAAHCNYPVPLLFLTNILKLPLAVKCHFLYFTRATFFKDSVDESSVCFWKYANINFCIVWRGCVCLCWPKITFDNDCSVVDAPATSLKQQIINKRRIFKGIICLFYRFLKSSKEEETFVVSYFWLIRSSACVQKQSRACTLVSECHPASMLLLSIAFGLFYIFMWCTVAGAKVIKSI